jgi:hypothetical protein
MNSLLVDIIDYLINEQSKLRVRGFKGMGTSQAFVDRKPPHLGTSAVEDLIRDESTKEETLGKKHPVKVSKAFSKSY